MRAFFFCLYSPVSSVNRPGIPQIAATPTSVNTMRDQMDALVQKGVEENDTILIGEYQFDYIF